MFESPWKWVSIWGSGQSWEITNSKTKDYKEKVKKQKDRQSDKRSETVGDTNKGLVVLWNQGEDVSAGMKERAKRKMTALKKSKHKNRNKGAAAYYLTSASSIYCRSLSFFFFFFLIKFSLACFKGKTSAIVCIPEIVLLHVFSPVFQSVFKHI